jgi:FSR family fosmidomycin resistance protein-like MFS transporter
MPALPVAVREPDLPTIDYRRVGLLSLGHFTNDMYGSLITSLMPYMVLRGSISATLAGLILLVYLLGSSFLQPIFGHYADRSGRRLLAVLGPIWVGIAAGLVGWSNGAALLFLLAAVGGVGTAAFHPQAASMVGGLSPRSKGWAMSIFSMGGNLGFALGPILAALISIAGLHWSPLIIIPGLLVTALLAMHAPRSEPTTLAPSRGTILSVWRSSWRALSLLVSVIATRSAVQFALIIFLPLYYHAHGGSAQLGSFYAFVLSLSGAVGGLFGGRLSDRFGRRVVVVTSLVLSVPLLIGTITVSGPLIWPLLVATGASLLASNSVTVVQGQELLPENTGVASGLTMGLGFGLSGVIASILTALSDHIGVSTALDFVPVLAVIAAGCAFLVPESAHERRRIVPAGDQICASI